MKFADKVPDKNNNVLVVDAMNVAFRWKHQKKLTFKEEYLRTVESLAISYNCSNIIITADQGNSSYRKDLLPSYKASRKAKYADQTEQEKEDMRKFFSEYEKALELLAEKYLILRRKEVEADDLAAFIVKNRQELGIDEVWLISSDGDWDLLVNDYVSKFSTVTRKETTVFNWDEFHDFPIESFISFKVLTGDKGDDVPGIPGIGPKRASDLIKQYGTAFDIYDNLPLEGSYKYIQAVNESEDLILENYYLMDLLSYCEEAIQFPGHDLSEMKAEITGFLNG